MAAAPRPLPAFTLAQQEDELSRLMVLALKQWWERHGEATSEAAAPNEPPEGAD